MTYFHGIRGSESKTSVGSPVEATAGLTVAVGTAPVNLGLGADAVNKPILAYSYDEAVKALGYSGDFDKFTLCEVIDTHFRLFGIAPVVFINVLDPVKHKTDAPGESINVSKGIAVIDKEGVLLDTVVVKLTTGGANLVKGTDYTLSFNDDGKVAIASISGGTITTSTSILFVTYSYLDPSKVTNSDIIGGYDATTGKNTGLELINSVFPMFRLVPGNIIAPKYSESVSVSAIMRAKAKNINSIFAANCIIDADLSEASVYTDVPSYKTDNSLGDPNNLLCWGKLKLGNNIYHLSSQLAALIAFTDQKNGDIPYVSPSNKSLQTDALIINGEEFPISLEQANYLNSNGIITALNFIGGWKLWGNRTSAFPDSTDVKDNFIPVRRMFNWVNNSIILSYWQQVDDPTNKRLIDSFVDGINLWMNGLTASGAILGGRIEFRPEDNPTDNLLNGIVKFKVFLASPTPAEDIEFTLEYDVSYLGSLFTA